MADEMPDDVPEAVSDAVWAHNRWPTIGLYTGAGVGVLVSVVWWLGLLWALAAVGGLAVVGLLVGYGLARLIYRRIG